MKTVEALYIVKNLIKEDVEEIKTTLEKIEDKLYGR